MVTGDHPLTASAVAQEIGLSSGSPTVISGEELEASLALGDVAQLGLCLLRIRFSLSVLELSHMRIGSSTETTPAVSASGTMLRVPARRGRANRARTIGGRAM
jgi:hypothetical protein